MYLSREEGVPTRMDVLAKTTRMNALMDQYGVLLTERQLTMMQLYYQDNLSLGEIAEECSVSRQAVNDALKRGEEMLEQFELKLRLIVNEEIRTNQLKQVLELIQEPRARAIILSIIEG